MKMKNPNGYGCIRIMSGNRRRPYAFIATVDGRQKYIAAFETIYDAKVFQAQYYEEHHRDFPPLYQYGIARCCKQKVCRICNTLWDRYQHQCYSRLRKFLLFVN